MGLVTKVKVGRITSLSDARYCAGMGVDWIGFNGVPQTHGYIDQETYSEITGWVNGPAKVLELNESFAKLDIQEVVASYQPDLVELHDRDIELTNGLDSKLIIQVDVESNIHSLLDFKGNIEFLIFNLHESIATPEESQLIKSLSSQFKLLLGPGIGLKEIKFLLSTLPVSGIALIGTDELKPGLKDYSSLSEVLDMLEN